MTKPREMTIDRLLEEYRDDLEAIERPEGAPWFYVWDELVRLQRNFADRLCAEVGTVEARRMAKGQRISATYHEKTRLVLADFFEKDDDEQAQAVSA